MSDAEILKYFLLMGYGVSIAINLATRLTVVFLLLKYGKRQAKETLRRFGNE